MKNFKFKIDGNTYDVAVEEMDKNFAEVQVNGKIFTVEIEGREKSICKPVERKTTTFAAPKSVAAPVAKPSAPKPSAGANTVKAPIPGTVFKIEASKGAAVKKGDVLLVLEAMKMENNILAHKDGVVKTIYVQLGQAVLQGDALLDVE